MSEFRLCLNTSTIRPASLMDKIRIASEAGFEAVELWLDDVIAYCSDGGTVADVRQALDDRGLTLPSMIALKGWSGTSGAEEAAGFEAAKQRLGLAAELGAPSVVATPTPDREPVAETARRYAKLLALGETFGVRSAFEYIGRFEQYNNINVALEVMASCGRQDTTMVVDAFHIFRGEGETDDLRRVAGERISIVHIDDAPAEPPRETQLDKDRVMPGDGVIDLGAMLAILREQGYRGWMSLELFNESYWARDPLEVAREGLAKTRAVLDA